MICLHRIQPKLMYHAVWRVQDLFKLLNGFRGTGDLKALVCPALEQTQNERALPAEDEIE